MTYTPGRTDAAFTFRRIRGRWKLAPAGLWLVLVLVSGLVQLTAAAAGQSANTPVVYSAEVDSIIHPASAEYMIETMRRADAEGATLVVFTLRTPGGLVDSTRDIVTQMLESKTPVAVFVGPSGGRAASAGFILILAADIAAMAPGTHIGAAHPVAGGGVPMDETTSKKAAEDVAAYVRTLANGRHRNVALAEEAVTESKAFTEEEALHAAPPLIDVVVSDVNDLLHKLDDRTITRFNGTTITLKTQNARIVPIEMSVRQQVLSAIAHPNIAYILLSLGTLGLTIELWNPGGILPGVVGGLCLLLAFFALQVLPVNYAGLLLMMFGLLLLVLEIKVTSFGLLTVGGMVSLILGSMMLVDSPLPEWQLSLGVVMPVVIGFTAIAGFLVRIGLAAQRRRSVTGVAGMIDDIGEVVSPLGPGSPGRVATHGEIWRAVAAEPIASGERVRVMKVDGLTLTVRKE